MGLMQRALRLLFPPGSAWRLLGILDDFVDGLADTLERPRTFLRSCLDEIMPYTATFMLEEWHEALDQKYDPTQTLQKQRIMLDAIQTAVGNSTLNQLNIQMHKEMPDVDVSEIIEEDTTSECGVAECGIAECASTLEGPEINPYLYRVEGEVEDNFNAARIAAVLEHFAPLHLVPLSKLVILSDSGTSECGIAECGIAECGSEE